MADIQKGVITKFVGVMPVVRPYGYGEALSPPLVNAHRACGDNPTCQYNGAKICPVQPLAVGDSVAFAMFEDGTGVVLAKM